MLVLALDSIAAQSGDVPWGGRRHDDDGPNVTAGTTSADLFDAVFKALHDGEQVAIGVDSALTAAPSGDAAPDEAALLQQADSADRDAGLAAVVRLLDELGHWRSWTAVSTSLPGWRATRSILVWQFSGGGRDAAVEAFFDVVKGAHGDAEADDGRPVINLVAAAAMQAGLTVTRGDLLHPVLRVELAG